MDFKVTKVKPSTLVSLLTVDSSLLSFNQPNIGGILALVPHCEFCAHHVVFIFGANVELFS